MFSFTGSWILNICVAGLCSHKSCWMQSSTWSWPLLGSLYTNLVSCPNWLKTKKHKELAATAVIMYAFLSTKSGATNVIVILYRRVQNANGDHCKVNEFHLGDNKDLLNWIGLIQTKNVFLKFCLKHVWKKSFSFCCCCQVKTVAV